MTKADWIAVDWGTSNCRVWIMDVDGSVLAHRTSDRGMGKLSPGDYEAVLLELVAEFLGTAPTPVLICGMAGAQTGWSEAPYVAVPAKIPDAKRAVQIPTKDPRLQVRILPGMSQASPPDVMRGEETQIGGYLAKDPKFDGILCLPGTHSKWVHISAEEVVSFRTFMTGELFASIAGASVVSEAVRGDGWNDEAFLSAVDDAMAKPEALLSRLFSLRAGHLLNGPDVGRRRAQLSGFLIGAEIAAARVYWLGQRVVLIGTNAVVGPYASALRHVGAFVEVADGEALSLSGLLRARV